MEEGEVGNDGILMKKTPLPPKPSPQGDYSASQGDCHASLKAHGILPDRVYCNNLSF